MTESTARLRGGIFAAALTLFDREERVAWEPWRQYLTWLCEAGLDGILVMGTTGEFPLLTLDERLEGIRVAQGVVPREKRLIVNVGAMTTRESTRLAAAAAAGPHPADLLLCGPPYYYQGTLAPERFVGHLRAVARETDCPLLYYHIPKMSHFAPSVGLLSEATGAAPLAGIKDSDGLGEYQRAVRARHPQGEFLYLTGSLPAALESWAAAGDGAILGMAASLPAACAALGRLWAEGDDAAAADIHQRLSDVWQATSSHGIMGLREVLRQTSDLGLSDEVIISGRRPFAGLGAEVREQIAAALRTSGITGE